MNYESHPIADIFPLMLPEEFVALKEDIKINGLLEPVWMYEGLILDGRSRCRACIESGVDIQVKEYLGNDPLGFVISLNLKRRYLNESQRRMAAAKLANLAPRRTDNNAANLQFEITRAEAEKLLLNTPDHTVKKVEQDVVSVSAAATTVPTLAVKEQKTAVAAEALPLFEAEAEKRNGLKPAARQQLVEQTQIAEQPIYPNETKADKKHKKQKNGDKKKQKSALDEQIKSGKKEHSSKQKKKKAKK